MIEDIFFIYQTLFFCVAEIWIATLPSASIPFEKNAWTRYTGSLAWLTVEKNYNECFDNSTFGMNKTPDM